MRIDQMRADVASVYPGDGWKERVRRMPDDQVVAVYHSFLNKGKFDKKLPPLKFHHDTTKEPIMRNVKVVVGCEELDQLSFEDILKG